MSYNLLFDTQFKNQSNHWKYINCQPQDNYIISNSKLFGLEQDILLIEDTKLYFRYLYNILTSSVFKTTIGIEQNSNLYINKKWTRLNKENLISVIEECKEGLVKVHIIFESTEPINKIYVKEPLLCDLEKIHHIFTLRSMLDNLIHYRYGYEYSNLLPYTEIKPEIFNLEKAKIGSIVNTLEPIKVRLNCNLIKNKRYLIKLNFVDINQLGDIYISYGMMKSKKYNNQLVLSFKATDKAELYLNIIPNDILPYRLNLKYIMLLNSEKVNVDNRDVLYLPYV